MGINTVSKDFIVKLEGYGLTTAEIHYHIPDHPRLLQQFIWQDYDIAPLFPQLKKFLDFWQRELDGALHSVRVAHDHLLAPSEWKKVDVGRSFARTSSKNFRVSIGMDHASMSSYST